jgi:ABC-2 type transport system ATP-binding protein
MSGLGVEVRDLVVRYGRTTAVDGATFSVRPGSITGVIGRNGSGKTSILSVLAAFRRADAGTVLVDGQDPWENPAVTERVCLVRESGDVLTEYSVRDNLRFLESTRATFSRELAERLLDTFELPARRKPSQLSRGKRSAFGITVGLASRAPLTLLDEVHLGLDAPSRYAFYDALLADYVEHPRTIVLSTHLVEEMQRLVEDVVVVHEGRVLLAEDADTLRARGTAVTGPADAVAAFADGRTVIGRQELGRTAQVTLYGRLEPDDVARARHLGLELAPVDLQDLFVHLTAPGGAAARQEVTP